MAHNFRRHIEKGLSPATCAFVSKAGSDASDGLTPDTPKKTILAACGCGRLNIIVGADVYPEQLGTACAGHDFYADGCVVLKGDAGQTLGNTNGDQVRFYDFIIFRYDAIPSGITTSQRHAFYYSCYIIGGRVASNGYGRTLFYDSTLKGMTIADSTSLSSGISLLRCNVLGTSVESRSFIQFSYFDSNSSLSVRDDASLPYPQNGDGGSGSLNIRCPITMDGVAYSSLADLQAARPGRLPASFSQEPFFNKPEKDDYTLKITSPHLNAGIGPRQLRLSSAWAVETDASPGESITAGNIRLRSVANPAVFVTPISTSNLIANAQGGIEVKPNSLGNNEGVITWNPRRIADAPTEINYYNFTTGLNFNADVATDAANPSPFNSNVPDYTNFTAGAAGRNPNRLTEQWRWSRSVAPDAGTASDWISGSVFLDFELFAAPWYNTNPIRGNGDPTFDWNAPRELPTATFVQSRWKLRQDRAL